MCQAFFPAPRAPLRRLRRPHGAAGGSFAAARGEADQARRAELKAQFRALAAEMLSLGMTEEELQTLVKEVIV